MLNYMGPNMGTAPVSAMLPPATPGTMPMGVQGVPPSPSPLPPQVIRGGGAGASPGALAAILNHAASGGAVSAVPPPPSYVTTTQMDGSILLHLKGPDGSVGPVVKVIPPIKRPESGRK